MKIDFPVIAIGASAGGLEPLELFFENVKTTSNFAFVIIQHLAPNHKSLMDELLARHTKLPILIIQNEMVIKRGHIYLNPPKKFVEIKEGNFKLSEKEDRKLSFPISSFFQSLAEEVQENACAIILSGTGSDGSYGIKFIKEKGGLVMAQDPEEAKFNGMPNNAIHTGLVDKACPIAMMHREIDLFFSNRTEVNQNYLETTSRNELITKILKSIQKQVNVDYTGYKYTTVSRRIDRRMNLLGYNLIEDYYQFISENPGEANLLSKELLIGVTRFFRDEEAFEVLKSKVIPQLVQQNSDTKNIRIWVTACSTGEEAYSIAILLKDYLRKNKLQFDVSIFATDIDKDAIKFAGNRIFSENIGTEIPPEYLNTYFIPQRSGYTVVKEIREMIVFSVHNLIQDAPFNKIDLISCRNFLIYLNDDIQQQLFDLFQYALKTNGFLFLGSSETLGEAFSEFKEFSKKHKIYSNIENKKFLNRPQFISQKNRTQIEGSQNPIEFNFPTRVGKNRMLNEIQQALIQEYVPDSMVIDEYFNLLHTSGSTHKWLTLPQGEISSNILKMMPDSIAMPIEVVAGKVFNTGKAISLTNIEIPEELRTYFGAQNSLNVHIRKMELQADMNYLLLTFENQVEQTKTINSEIINISAASKDKINILEQELKINRETLQTTIEELESSNEELQAANEELQSSNEELESVNEELYTVNSEYQQKNTELSQANDDLNHLIQSTEIALLFLDSNLNIRKFTSAIKHILELAPHDTGRHISHFRGKIQLDNFMEQVENVLANLIPFESKVKDIKGIEYLLKIAPFRTNRNEIQGVVLIFIDLTQANKLKNEIELSDKALSDLKSSHANQNEIFELITTHFLDMVIIIDKKGNIEYCTPSGTKMTGYSMKELYHLNLFGSIPDGYQKDVLINAVEGFQNDREPGLIQFEFKKSNDKNQWFEASLKPLNLKKKKDYRVLLTIRDIHEQKLRDEEFYRLSLIAEQTSSAVIITDVEGKITFANVAFEKMTGYKEEEILGRKPGDFLQGEESDPKIVKQMRTCIQDKLNFDVNIINYSKAGDKYQVNIKAEPLYDKADNFIGFFSIQNDITTEQEQISHIQALNQKVNDQNRKLVEVNKALEEFAYVASHDLKTPVRNIRGLMGIIQKKGETLDPEKRKNYLDVVLSSSEELNRMIENLLQYSRDGSIQEERELISLPNLMDSVIQQFSKELGELGAVLTTEIQVDKIVVYPILFKRLATNLISNAIKYRSKKNLEIKFSCTRDKDILNFKIEDNGIGIHNDHFEDIFKIFRSLRPNKDSNGIGLSVCKKIVELHGGDIWLTSKENKGTTFNFTIPNATL